MKNVNGIYDKWYFNEKYARKMICEVKTKIVLGQKTTISFICKTILKI